MTEIFSSTSGRRRVMVDEEGIHGEQNSLPAALIPWSELISLNRLEARSTRGIRIRILIAGVSTRDKCRKCISACWKERHPDLWEQNRRRVLRSMKTALYFTYPAAVLAVESAGYAFFRWAPGFSDAERTEHLDRMLLHCCAAMLTLAITIAALSLYLPKKRAEATA